MTSAPKTAPVIDERFWQRRFDELAAAHRVPGGVLGIIRIGDAAADGDGAGAAERFIAATGTTNIETGSRTVTDTLFQIGSVTKVWTATLVMCLMDRGLLELDRPIIEVLPELKLGDPETESRVTLRHLLTHTSGIAGDVFLDTGNGDDSLRRYVAELSRVPPVYPLGATWSYCNAGFSIVGRVVEAVTGLTWDQALHRYLLEPLGLSETCTLLSEVPKERLAAGHNRTSDGSAQAIDEPVALRSLGPAGALITTVDDVLTFASVHLTGGLGPDGKRILSSGAVSEMARRQAQLPEHHTFGDSWGLGWSRSRWGDAELIGHDGNVPGQAAFLRLVPAAGVAVTLVVNGGNSFELYEALFDEIFHDLVGIRAPGSLAPRSDGNLPGVETYLGRYERDGVLTEVYRQESMLRMRTTLTGRLASMVPDPIEDHRLLPVDGELFAYRDTPDRSWTPVVFYQLPDGQQLLHTSGRANPRVADDAPATAAADRRPRRSLIGQQQLQDELDRRAAEGAVVGAVAGISVGGQTIWAGWGVRSVDSPLPVDSRTVFQVGSIGKTITATVLMRLQEQGLLRLTDPVQRHVPEFALADQQAARTVTVLQLLNHTAGWEGDRFDDTGDGDDALAAYVALMADFEQEFDPGAGVSYNNASLSLAGRVIEKVTEMSYESAVQQMIFDPCGLTESFYFPNDVMTRPFAVGHVPGDDGGPRVARPWAMARSSWPAGGSSATITDLLAWGRFHLGDGRCASGEQVLRTATLRHMQQPTVETPGGSLGDGIGIGWMLREIDGVRTVGHGGSSNGQFGELVLVPDHDLVVAVLSNSDPGGAVLNRRMVEWALERCAGLRTSPPTWRVADPPSLQDYCGVYRVGSRMSFEVRAAAGHLLLTPTVDPELLAQITADQGVAPDIPSFRLGIVAGEPDRYVVIDPDGNPDGQVGRFVRGPHHTITGIDFGGRLARRDSDPASDRGRQDD